MATVSVKVKIPDGWELACDEMRPVQTNEQYLRFGVVRTWGECGPSKYGYVIVRQAWQWPSWLRPEIVSIAMDANGSWWSYLGVCQMAGCDWVGWPGGSLNAFDQSLLPRVDDWRQSRRIKPGHEVQS